MKKNRNLFYSVCCCLLLLFSTNQSASTNQGEDLGTSDRLPRSRLMPRNMHRVRYSGDVFRTPEPPSIRLAAIPSPQVRSFESFSEDFIRISNDLFANDSMAQAGAQAEPYIDANPFNGDNLLAGWQENRFINGGARLLNYAVSFDGGKSWSESTLPNLTTANGGFFEKASDPWVAFGPNNRAYYASLLFNVSTLDNAIGVSASTDGGKNWGSPVEVFRSTTTDFNDKEAVVVDKFPNSPFFGSVYVSWDINIFNNAGDITAQRLVAARSTDGGISYEKPVAVQKTGGNVGVIPKVGPDGTVYLIWVGGGLNSPAVKVFFSKSRDGGVTFSRRKKIGSVQSRGIQNARTGSFLASFDVDPTTGDLYVAWEDSRFTGNDQPAMIISRDGGESWSDLTRVGDGPDDAPTFTISAASAGNGTAAVSYYSLQNDPSRRFLVDRYIRISEDGGRTFQPSVRITPSAFDMRLAAQSNGGFFLGDYVGLAGIGRRFHAVWVDTRNISPMTGRMQPDVFAAGIKF